MLDAFRFPPIAQAEGETFMVSPNKDIEAARARMITRAWRDPAFKKKLAADPKAVLAEAGINLPAGVTVSLVEDSDTHLHLVLPARPAALSDAQLDAVAGGDSNPTQMPGIPWEVVKQW
jgi:hypothetical protein